MNANSDKLYGTKITMLLLLLITVLRIFHLSLGQFNLFFDEAQYWIWAQNPSLGYYSKPPMVAWFITLTTSLCGDSEFCTRLSSPLLHFVTAIAIYFTAFELFNSKKAKTKNQKPHDSSIPFFCALTYITLPAVSVSSMLVSTDCSLLMFWALTLLFFVKAIHNNRLRWWLLAGICGGLGMLSKYNMVLFFGSAFLYFALSKENRHYLKSWQFWLAGVLAMAIFLPNILWNMQNHMVSFEHTSENATASSATLTLHPGNMLEFIGAQFGVFGPILFAALLWIMGKFKTTFKNDKYRLLLLNVLPLLCVIIAVSLISRAHANWAAPVYVPATILVVAWLINHRQKTLVKISLYLHIFVAILLMTFPYIAKIPHVHFTGAKTQIEDGHLYIKDPFKRLRGWSDLGEGVSMLLKAYPDTKLLTDARKIHSELLYYVHPHPFDAVKWNPTGKLGDHFDLTTDINNAGTKNFLYVTMSNDAAAVVPYFESIERVGNVEVAPYKDFTIDYYIYYAVGFKGYDADLTPPPAPLETEDKPIENE
jgi:hypothetical protein